MIGFGFVFMSWRAKQTLRLPMPESSRAPRLGRAPERACRLGAPSLLGAAVMEALLLEELVEAAEQL